MSLASKAMASAAAVWWLLPAVGAGQLVPGAPATDWDRAQNEYRLTVLRDYNALIGEWRSGLNGDDGGAAASAYADSATLLVGGRPPVQGRDSIAAFLRTFGAGLLEIRTGLSEFLASDKLAYAAGPVMYTFREGATGVAQVVSGHHLTVLVREGRRWRIRSQVLQYEPPRSADP